MALDAATVTAIVTAVIGVSSGLLAWASQVAKTRGEKYKQNQDSLTESRVDREAMIASLTKELERVNAARDKAVAECEKAEDECVEHRSLARFLEDEIDARDQEARPLKTWAREACVEIAKTNPDFPQPPIPPNRPDPITAFRTHQSKP